jgi:hypothetical protein
MGKAAAPTEAEVQGSARWPGRALPASRKQEGAACCMDLGPEPYPGMPEDVYTHGTCSTVLRQQTSRRDTTVWYTLAQRRM